MKLIVLISIFVFCLGLIHCAEEENCRPAHCAQIACDIPYCQGIQEGGPWVLRQQPCECCPGCYVERKAGEECGKDKETLCVEGLKCIDNKCQA